MRSDRRYPDLGQNAVHHTQAIILIVSAAEAVYYEPFAQIEIIYGAPQHSRGSMSMDAAVKRVLIKEHTRTCTRHATHQHRYSAGPPVVNQSKTHARTSRMRTRLYRGFLCCVRVHSAQISRMPASCACRVGTICAASPDRTSRVPLLYHRSVRDVSVRSTRSSSSRARTHTATQNASKSRIIRGVYIHIIRRL